MSKTGSNYARWTLVCGGLVARIISHTNTLPVIYICFIFWTHSPNQVVAILLSLTVTSVVVHLYSNLCNIAGLIAKLLDCLFSTESRCFTRFVRFVSFRILKIHGKLIHGYEIHGKEKLPKNRGGLIVYPHQLIPYDILYLMAEYYVDCGRTLGGIIHRDLEMLTPGLCATVDLLSGRERLVERLKRGQICTVAPGGGFEAVFGQNHELMWNNRTGFAAVAKKCGIPIIPMFTTNGHQSMPIRLPGFRNFLLEVYEETRRVMYLPVIRFPVKMRIILGTPLFCEPNESPVEFAKRVEDAIYDLRDKHQRGSGSFFVALLERFGYRPPTPECGGNTEN